MLDRLSAPVCVILPFFAVMVAANAQAQPTVNTHRTDATAPMSPLKLEAGEASGVFSLFLHNTKDEPVEIRELAVVMSKDDGRVIPQCRLTLLDTTTQKEPAALVVAARGAADLTLKVDNLLRVGQFKRHVNFLEKGEGKKWEQATSFDLVRSGQLRIRGVDYTTPVPIVKGTATSTDYRLTFDLYESQGHVPIKGLLVDVGRLTTADGLQDGNATVKWTIDGAQKAVDFDKYKRKQLVLKGRLPKPGKTYSTWMTLTYEGRVETHTLELIRSAIPALTLLQAHDKTVKLEVAGPDFTRPLTVINDLGSPDVDSWSLKVTNLRRQNKAKSLQKTTVQTLPLASGAKKLPAGSSQVVTLQGKQLEVATYEATLVLLNGVKPQYYELEIKRSPPKNNLKLGEPKPAAEMCWDDLWTTAKVDIEFVLRETSATGCQVQAPRVSLYRSKGTEKEAVYDYELALFERLDNLSKQGIPKNEKNGGPTPAQLLDLGGTARKDYVATIGNLGSGAYEGEVEVLGPNSVPVTAQFKINVQAFWLWPLVCIVLGVVGSFFLQWFTRVGRARYLRSAMIAEERAEIDRRYTKPPRDEVWDSLLERLEDLQRDDRFTKGITAAQVVARLNNLSQRRRKYDELQSQRDSVQKLLEGFPEEPPEMLTNKRRYLKQMNDRFREGSEALLKEAEDGLGDGPEDVPDKITALRTLFGTIRDESIRQPLAALVEQLTELMKFRPLQKKASDVKEQVVKLKNRVGGEEPIEDLAQALETHRREYADLRAEMIVIQCGQLTSEIDTSPHVSTDANLQTAQAHIGQALSASRQAKARETSTEKLDECEVGYHLFLGAQIEHLAYLASTKACPVDIAEADWERIRLEEPSLPTNIQQARKTWEADETELAAFNYKAAYNGFGRVLVALLEYRIEQTSERFKQLPHLETRSLMQLDQVTKAIRNRLPAAGDEEARSKVRDGRAKLAEAQVEVLQAAGKGFQTYYDQQKAAHTDPNNPDDEVDKWTRAIPEALKELKAETENALTFVRRFSGAADKSAALGDLLNAEKSSARAQALCESMAKLLGAETMSLDEVTQAANEAASLSLVEMAASPIQSGVHSRSMASPEASSLREHEERKEPQASPEDWYKLVRYSDWVVFGITIALASLIGLFTVWAGDPDFGAPMDYFTALLWGFGAQSATSGLTDLARQFGQLPKEA